MIHRTGCTDRPCAACRYSHHEECDHGYPNCCCKTGPGCDCGDERKPAAGHARIVRDGNDAVRFVDHRLAAFPGGRLVDVDGHAFRVAPIKEKGIR